MHVRRVVNGKRQNLTYSELRMEEFVFSFIAMLKSPRNKKDTNTMIDLLQILMQDAMDYSWGSALGFYESIGLEVEHGMLKWNNNARITDLPMTYSRAVFPEKKEAKETKEVKEGARPTPKQAPPGMRCCAAFQRRSCEQPRDHQPFTHACSYCLQHSKDNKVKVTQSHNLALNPGMGRFSAPPALHRTILCRTQAHLCRSGRRRKVQLLGGLNAGFPAGYAYQHGSSTYQDTTMATWWVILNMGGPSTSTGQRC